MTAIYILVNIHVQLDYFGLKGTRVRVTYYPLVTCFRALEFVYVFLDSVVNGEHDLVKCANIAYDKSLRIYHGWIVRGVFTVSIVYYY